MKLIEIEQKIVRKYLGAKYQLRGRNVGSGLDCYGIILAIYQDLGYSLIDVEEEYSEDWSEKGKNYFISNYWKQWDVVPTPCFLDVVFFNNSRGMTNHAGVILTVGKFIHCNKSGVTVSRLNDPQWKPAIEGFYHLRARHDTDH